MEVIIESFYLVLYGELGRLPGRPKDELHPIADRFVIEEKIKDGLHFRGRELRTSCSAVFHDRTSSDADDFWGVSRRLYIAGTSASTPSWGSFAAHLYHRANEARLRYKFPDIPENCFPSWV
ncbi:hypothetical protein BT96DRAFT_404894 [Gymnopus androsaceus JB14]|uniref:Uncharacterized protein n=1 Tax=Gymnopus androsaceus JB14 TaxID=1447944 RepID=A0A6A4I7R9_9AGAR|nr:hypothetical protein BT96DRAFT_404894 [Gymnopus androsaceus JB14]